VVIPRVCHQNHAVAPCHRHNPDFGSFPTLARLTKDVKMWFSALNGHLATLKCLSLIHRIRGHDPHSHKCISTRCILGFEKEFPQKQTQEASEYPCRKTFNRASKDEDTQAHEINPNHFLSETLNTLGLDLNGKDRARLGDPTHLNRLSTGPAGKL
jgi:hypothetical protein